MRRESDSRLNALRSLIGALLAPTTRNGLLWEALALGDTQRKDHEETLNIVGCGHPGCVRQHRACAESSAHRPAKAAGHVGPERRRPDGSRARDGHDGRAEQHQPAGRRWRSGLSDAARGPGARRGAQYATPKPQAIRDKNAMRTPPWMAGFSLSVDPRCRSHAADAICLR
jgi:hypothetical protein